VFSSYEVKRLNVRLLKVKRLNETTNETTYSYEVKRLNEKINSSNEMSPNQELMVNVSVKGLKPSMIKKNCVVLLSKNIRLSLICLI